MTDERVDERYMREALRLAKKGAGRTGPNPMVGALVVRNGTVIGRGYHRAFGMPHAEVEALREAGVRARGATLYATLEPCKHFGKTPPCADAIVASGIGRVVCATRDPNPIARGGIRKLRNNGIAVSIGTLAHEARALNEAFYVFHEKHRPFVALKFAASLDGKLATKQGDSKWLTNPAARAYGRKLRGRHDAILVGVNTVLADDPALTSRTKGAPDPMRVILDSRLRAPLSARVFRDRNVVVATTNRAPKERQSAFKKRGIKTIVFRGKNIPVRGLLDRLRSMSIMSVLVEGGGGVLGSFLDARAVDRVYIFYGPVLIGGAAAIAVAGEGVRRLSEAPRLWRLSMRRFADNIVVIGDTAL